MTVLDLLNVFLITLYKSIRKDTSYYQLFLVFLIFAFPLLSLFKSEEEERKIIITG